MARLTRPRTRDDVRLDDALDRIDRLMDEIDTVATRLTADRTAPEEGAEDDR